MSEHETVQVQPPENTAKALEAAKRFVEELVEIEGQALKENAPGLERGFAIANSAATLLLMALAAREKNVEGAIVGLGCGALCFVYQGAGEMAAQWVGERLAQGMTTGVERSRLVMGRKSGGVN